MQLLAYVLQAAGHVLLLDWTTSKQFLSHFYWMLCALKSKDFHQPENLVDEEEDAKGEEAGAGEGEADICMSILNVEVLLPPLSNMELLCFELLGNVALFGTIGTTMCNMD
ncbi:hypothetical protein F2Q70_00036425 [Brassica cretica]|uniref:Uncharacterized protein n=1 Tax=Brassica cretica TaxID=69181 RepID=A0A8S9JN46_BRACR|nr:hypothetical protein F2Q70_00036425 [Brassica cretica]